MLPTIVKGAPGIREVSSLVLALANRNLLTLVDVLETQFNSSSYPCNMFVGGGANQVFTALNSVECRTSNAWLMSRK